MIKYGLIQFTEFVVIANIVIVLIFNREQFVLTTFDTAYGAAPFRRIQQAKNN